MHIKEEVLLPLLDVQVEFEIGWKPSQIQGTFEIVTGDVGDVYNFRINEYGRLMTETATMCTPEATGPEFNPLTEKNHYGQVNPF